MKRILKVLCSFIVLISASLILFACDEKEIKILQTPIYFGIVNNAELSTSTVAKNETRPYVETPELLLVTEKNRYASDYKFYISNDGTNYISFSPKVKGNNYLDVTEIFKDKKEYYYRVQYIGEGDYSNSEISTAKKFVPDQEQISAPYVQVVDKTLCWTQIINAEKYEIYETIVDGDNKTVTEKTKIGETNATTYSYSLSSRTNNPYYKYQYEVKAIASKYYLNSELSNKAEYIKSIKLNTVSGLAVNNGVLSWNKPDSYTTGYEIKVNNTVVGTSTTENLDISSYLTNPSGYTFSVQAKTSNALNYTAGDYCADYSYNYTITLEKPVISNVQLSESNYQVVEITFNYNSLAASGYTLQIEYNGNNIYSIQLNDESKVGDNIVVGINYCTELFKTNEITEDKNIKIKVKANAVNDYIFESAYYEMQYKILKPVTE